MPTTISTRVERRSSSAVQPSPTTYKFPDMSEDAFHLDLPNDSAIADHSRSPSPNGRPLGTPLGPLGLPRHLHSSERWQGRRSGDFQPNGSPWGNGTIHAPPGGTRHGRQKSLSEAIRNVRTRKGSVSQNAHEIADALKAPVSGRIIVRRKNTCTASSREPELMNCSSSFAVCGTPPPSSPIPPPRQS